jgi:2-(1,2-epoxy-1,2-dihydrophenyl)acetyl-CoA isomerase
MADTSSPSSDAQGAPAPVRYEVDGAVATVTLDRPSAMNALDIATKDALLAALRRAADDEAVRAVVLTGSGRAFCVGQDLREHASLLEQATAAAASADPAGGQGSGFQLDDTVRDHYNPIVTLIATMAKPVVAAVNGVAAGAGAAFTFACDVRLVAQSAGFNLAFSAIGLSCDSGSSWSLPRLVGLARAKELLFFPRTVGADEALTLGLATTVVPDDELAAAAAELAGRLAAGPTASYAAIRSALLFSQTHDLPESLAHEAELMGSTGRTADHAAAVRSFLAKEPPTFTGR